MTPLNKAVKINLLDFKSPQMRAFHMTWFAFFLCFFSWFGIAPLMAHVREEFSLTKEQIGNTIIASVSATIFARLFLGWACDRIGPRITYSCLLILGSIPVMGVSMATDYHSLLLFRIAIGLIGASFVITQYHTSLMFAPNVVGTANATTAGWGNLGGGATNILMPIIMVALMSIFGIDIAWGWRASMISVGILCLLMGIAYFFLTQDTPNGNFKDIRAQGGLQQANKLTKAETLAVLKDYRVWLLFVVYGACFGIELTINNTAALYYHDYFDLNIKTAGLIAGLFGLMNLFARTLGGFFGDKFGIRKGLKGRVQWLLIVLACEGVVLILFSRMGTLPLVIGTMIVFSLFVQMSEGATYSVVPFINKKAVGLVSGIVGAGGNAGAMAAGFLFRGKFEWNDAYMYLGVTVLLVSFTVPFIRFSLKEEQETRLEIDASLREKALQGA